MVLLQELEESGYIEFCGGSIDSGVKAERDLLVAEGETVDQHNVQFWALFLMGELGGRLLKPCPVEWLVQ
jgi:hypothetical protein